MNLHFGSLARLVIRFLLSLWGKVVRLYIRIRWGTVDQMMANKITKFALDVSRFCYMKQDNSLQSKLELHFDDHDKAYLVDIRVDPVVKEKTHYENNVIPLNPKS